MNGPWLERWIALPLRLAARDLKGGFAGFRVFIACIVLGVTAIVGVGSTARSLLDSVAREGQRILGGDVAFTTVLREAQPEEQQWFAAKGSVSQIASMRAMARKENSGAVLVEIKAVDSAYPAIGTTVTMPASTDLAGLLRQSGDAHGLIGDAALAARLDLREGDRLFIGDAPFIWRGILVSEPDKLAGGMSFGPRAMMSIEALRASGLVQPGSLVRWSYRIGLPSVSGTAGRSPALKADVEQVVREAERLFPDAGWRVSTRERVSPGFARNLERFSQFLTLVGLTALMIGGIGVANAVRGFVNRKRSDFAVLKAVGSPGSFVFYLALVEVLLAATIGVAIGTVLGMSLPFAIKAFLGAVIPIPFTPALQLREITLGIGYGYLAAILFSIAPLGRVHETPVSSLFRDSLQDNGMRLRSAYRLAIVTAAAAFLGVIFATATDRFIAAIYVASAVAILFLLQGVGAAIAALARSMPRSGRVEWRIAIANLGRPGALTRPVVASTGLGLSLFVALSTIDVNIREPLAQGIPGQTPSFFFMDVQSSQAAEFATFVRSRAPEATLEMVPMLRGRLTRIDGADVRTIKARENARWVLEGDRGITFAADLPAGSKLADGDWWARDYKGPPLVSVDAEIAEGLGIRVGSSVTLNVLGRNITAKVANLREVNWRSYGINFVFVLTPSTFAGVPHTILATATSAAGAGAPGEQKLVGELAREYPTVTTIRLKETLDAVADIARQIGVAIRGATFVTLIASTLVLAGALAAGQASRIYDTLVLKVLGATRNRLLLAYAAEFLLLGLTTALFAIAAGTATGWAILKFALDLDTFSPDWRGALQTVLLTMSAMILLGLGGTWRILGLKPAASLRNS